LLKYYSIIRERSSMKTLVTVYRPELKNMIFTGDTIKKLESISEVDWVEEGKQYTIEDLTRDIGNYDAVITGWGSPKITPEVLANASKLKFIGHTAGSVAHLFHRSVFDKNITIVNANTPLAMSTAEASLALMMAGAWNIHGFNQVIKQGLWSNHYADGTTGLANQVIGLIGLGEISREVMRLLKPFNVKILLNSRYCTQEEAARLGVELVSLDDLLKRSDIVSLHNTLTTSTVGMLGKRELALIRDGGLIVNTARSPIIDEEALIENLKNGRLFAALDVFDQEPLPKEHILLHLTNVLCTPHIGGLSRYWKSQLGRTVVDDLERFIKGEPVSAPIDEAKYKRMTTT
jgi:phosphoglycerate dehydrogenase-like enzyme